MAQSICQIYAHIVFSTKNREPYFPESVRPQVHAYLAGILRNLGCASVLIGGFVDHVHCLCLLNKMEAPVKIIQQLKQDSSKYFKTMSPSLSSFAWQRGYGLFSVSPTHEVDVRRYIEDQAEHHRTKTFQEEYREFLEKYKVSFDERYVWD